MKRFFTATLCLLTLAPPVYVAFLPNTAQASVPVHEYYLTGLFPGQGGTLPGEFAAKESNLFAAPLSAFKISWDAVAWFFVKLILHELTKALVQWIRTGQDPAFFLGTEGSLFVTNIDEFLLDAADNQAGIFLREYFGPSWDKLCSPFRLPVGFNISNSYGRGYGSFQFKARCSILDVVDNLENFYGDFRNGGWAAWMKTARYENTAWGLLSLSEAESEERESRAVRASQTDSLAGLGFPGDRTCVQAIHTSGAVVDNPDMSGPDASNLSCLRYITKTPGKAVEDQVANVYGNEIRSLGVADELDEVLSSVFSALLTWILSGGSEDGLLGAPVANQPGPGHFGDGNDVACQVQTNRRAGCQCTPGAQQCATGLTCLPSNTCGPIVGPENCTDGIDNDNDGLIDSADPDCVGI